MVGIDRVDTREVESDWDVVAVAPTGRVLASVEGVMASFTLDGVRVATREVTRACSLAGFSPSGDAVTVKLTFDAPTFQPMPVSVLDIESLSLIDVVAPVQDGLAKVMASWHGDDALRFLQYGRPITGFDVVMVDRSGRIISQRATPLTVDEMRPFATAPRTFDDCLVVDVWAPGERRALIMIDTDGSIRPLDRYGLLEPLAGDAILDVARDGTRLIAGGMDHSRARFAPLRYVSVDHPAVSSPFDPTDAALNPDGHLVAAIVVRFDPEPQPELVIWEPLRQSTTVITSLPQRGQVVWTAPDTIVVWTNYEWTTITIDTHS